MTLIPNLLRSSISGSAAHAKVETSKAICFTVAFYHQQIRQHLQLVEKRQRSDYQNNKYYNTFRRQIKAFGASTYPVSTAAI